MECLNEDHNQEHARVKNFTLDVDFISWPGIKVGAELVHVCFALVVDKYGVSVEIIIREFIDDVQKSDIISTHNLALDKVVLLSSLHRIGCLDGAENLRHARVCAQ